MHMGDIMGENFKRFKKRAFLHRLLGSVLGGISAGLATAGALLLLYKLEVISLLPLYCALIGGGAALLVGGALFLILGGSDAALASRLDRELGLYERVGTMVAYSDSPDGMHVIQREDAEEKLSLIPTSRLRFKRLWIFLAALLVGAALLAVGIIVKDQRTAPEPPKIKPFALSAMQEAGIIELIAYVDTSEMDEPYKAELKDELGKLLTELKAVDTEPQMLATMAASLTEISAITYDSSSMTEILNALWATGGDRIQALAKALDTTEMTDPDWGEFADNYNAYIVALSVLTVSDAEGAAEPTDAERLAHIKWSLEDVSIKVARGLTTSGIKAGDPLYDILTFMVSDGEVSEDGAFGYAALLSLIDDWPYEIASAELTKTLNAMSEPLFNVISRQKINANTGEYVQRKLSVLFEVPIPPFERPTLKDSGTSGGGDDDQSGATSGGVGEGVQYGSDDLVLDPLTGKYVKYSELYAKYNTLMLEKLSNADYGYTEAQKKAIEKYFALLYSGFKAEK